MPPVVMIGPARWSIPTSECPRCRRVVTYTSGEKPPAADDFHICHDCGFIRRFDADLRLVDVSLDLLRAIAREDPPHWAEVSAVCHQIAAAYSRLLRWGAGATFILPTKG